VDLVRHYILILHRMSPVMSFKATSHRVLRQRSVCRLWLFSVFWVWYLQSDKPQLQHINFEIRLLCVPIYARLQIFIQLSLILAKLCHIKRDYPVHITCSKMSTIGQNACIQTFA